MATRELKDATEQASTIAYGVAKLAADGVTTPGLAVQASDTRLNLGASIDGATAKATPVDADELVLADSAAAFVQKKLTWANLKAGVQALTDTLYAALTHASRHKSGGADPIRLDELAAPTADVSMATHKIVNLGTPTAASDAVTKAYADALATGLTDFKQSVKVATTVAGAIATDFEAGDTVDGLTLLTGDRILIKNQITQSQNGIYTVNASGAPTRATDADTDAKVTAGMYILVTEGAVNGDTSWVLTTDDPITLGSSALVFAQFSGAGTTVAHAATHAAAGSDPVTLTAVQISNFNAAVDAELPAATHAATSKATPVDADELPLADSAASFGLKKLTWANLKATAKTYFDTLYAAITHTHAAADVTSGVLAIARLATGTPDGTKFVRDDGTLAVPTGSGYAPGGTDVAIADGGTGQSTATLGFNALSPLTTRGDLLTRDATNNVRKALGTAGQRLKSDGTDPQWGDDFVALTFVIDGGGATITTGIKGDLEIPDDLTITRVTLLADQSGSIVVDLWVDTYANYPPTVADTIVASAKPTITTATKSQDVTLTGWTVDLSAGSILRYNVDSVTTIQRCTVALRCKKRA